MLKRYKIEPVWIFKHLAEKIISELHLFYFVLKAFILFKGLCYITFFPEKFNIVELYAEIIPMKTWGDFENVAPFTQDYQTNDMAYPNYVNIIVFLKI